MQRTRWFILCGWSAALAATVVAAAAAEVARPAVDGPRAAAGPPATPNAARGRDALLGTCYSGPMTSRSGYESLWRQWGVAAKPADYAAAVADRYGLHPAPYPNDGLPMGLRPAAGVRRPGVGIDCMTCHGGSIFGTSYVGLPNTSLDLTGLFTELMISNGLPALFPYRVSNARGTTEATATAVFLGAFRHPDLSLKVPAEMPPIPDQMCEDPPAWWLLKRKRTMYHTGQSDARAVRPLMAFLLGDQGTPKAFADLEPTFADVQAYLLSLEAPKYPFPVDGESAAKGKLVFAENCAKCHGTYGPGGIYPNKIVPLEQAGTDPTKVRSLTPAIEANYRKSWFAGEVGPNGKPLAVAYPQGYQAPPLDGVWATAPYFHNGSVPTLAGVLKSGSADRPARFTRSFRTGVEDYDPVRVGWKVTAVPAVQAVPAAKGDGGPPAAESSADRRRVYDTSQTGRSNAGHTYGDDLTDAERRAVIEYLKTL
jgi:mono/diheme cytochrome c family protein